jgi:hypothetical protein
MTFAPLGVGLRGLPAIPGSPQIDKSAANPLVDFALLQSLPGSDRPFLHATPKRRAHSRTHSPEVSRPYSARGDGERPAPGFQARLCSASRLSQPPDALLPPKPCRFCFAPAALMGFALQRFSLPNCRDASQPPVPLVTFLSTARRGASSESDPFPRRRVASSAAPRSGFGAARKGTGGVGRVFRGFSPVRESVLRSAGVTRRWEPILSWVSSLQGVPPHRLDTTAAVSPLLRFVVRVPKQASAGAPGFRKRRGWLASLETAAPRGLSVLVPGSR